VPMHLDALDEHRAIFVGNAEESYTVNIPIMGDAEVNGKWPVYIIQRAVWETLECPTQIFIAVRA
jgi:hypothetical protein